MRVTVSETGADLLHAIDRLFEAIDAEYQQRSQPGRAASNVAHDDAGLHVIRDALRASAGRVVRERVDALLDAWQSRSGRTGARGKRAQQTRTALDGSLGHGRSMLARAAQRQPECAGT